MRPTESHQGLFPLAYLLTWSTYGTWLPGDERGWTKHQGTRRSGMPGLEAWSRDRLKAAPTLLNIAQRQIVHETIEASCRVRGWHLHAVNCRSNHVHGVVSAALPGGRIERYLKTWCSRRLNDELRSNLKSGSARPAIRWWAEGGNRRRIDDAEALERAITYVMDGQGPGRFAD